MLRTVEGAVATLTLNRPEQLNPLDRHTVAELNASVDAIEADETVSVVVVRGAGRAFSAGGDLAGYLRLYRNPAEFMAFLRALNRLFEAIERSRKIYVAVVQGHCVAGGLELMLACDIVIAANEARISDGHLRFAQLPGAGGSRRLPRAIGHLRAKLLVLTGREVDGAEAERIGLASLSVPLAELDDAVAACLGDLLRNSPLGLEGAKYLVNTGTLAVRDPALELELHYVNNYATTSHDAYEGLAAFAEKRSPNLKGR